MSEMKPYPFSIEEMRRDILNVSYQTEDLSRMAHSDAMKRRAVGIMVFLLFSGLLAYWISQVGLIVVPIVLVFFVLGAWR